MPQVVTGFALAIAPVPRSGTEELSPALQRWVGVMDEPSPSGTTEKHVLRLARDDRRLRVAIPPFRKRSERMGHPTVLCNDRGPSTPARKSGAPALRMTGFGFC